MAIQPTALSQPKLTMSGLTIEQFNGLFEKYFPEALASLAESAGNGNLVSIYYTISLYGKTTKGKKQKIFCLIYLVESCLQRKV